MEKAQFSCAKQSLKHEIDYELNPNDLEKYGPTSSYDNAFEFKNAFITNLDLQGSKAKILETFIFTYNEKQFSFLANNDIIYEKDNVFYNGVLFYLDQTLTNFNCPSLNDLI
jgi:hypothetical protein